MSDPIRVRASGLGELFDCAHRWEGKHLLNLGDATSSAAYLGTAIHASTALFDRSRVEKIGLTVSDCASEIVRLIREPTENVLWDQNKNQLEMIGLQVHTKYCTEYAPKQDYVSVEMQLEPMDINVDGVTVQLTGTMDRARVSRSGGFGIKDLKTGVRAVDGDGKAVTKGHKAQLGVYEILFEHTTGQKIEAPGQIVGLKTSGQFEIGTGDVPEARRIVVGWPDQPGLLEMGAKLLKEGNFPPNPRSQLCSPKFCPRWTSCKFHD